MSFSASSQFLFLYITFGRSSESLESFSFAYLEQLCRSARAVDCVNWTPPSRIDMVKVPAGRSVADENNVIIGVVARSGDRRLVVLGPRRRRRSSSGRRGTVGRARLVGARSVVIAT